MKINKSLKFADFSYDEGSKVFTITDKNGNEVELNKVYSFAFMRFVIRIAQRNWLRSASKFKKIVDKPPQNDIVSEEAPENPNQLFFDEIENEAQPTTLTSPSRWH